MTDNIKNILIINLGGIGDLLLSTPALRGLAARYPGAKLSFLVSRQSRQAIEDLPYAQEIFLFDLRYGGIIPLTKIIHNLGVIFHLRQKKFDLAINMRTLVSNVSAFKMKWLLRLISAGVTVGRDTEGRGSFFNVRIPESYIGEKSEMEYDIDTVCALGATVTDKSIDFALTQEHAAAVDRLLRACGVPSDAVLIGIHPGGMPSRRWPADNFVQVIRLLGRDQRFYFIISGGTSEISLGEKIARDYPQNTVSTVGQLSIKELGALMQRCALFISNDTGPMHIAALLNVPLIALLGPGDIARYDPRNLSKQATALFKKTDCSPCVKVDCQTVRCLAAITPQEVITAAQRFLAR